MADDGHPAPATDRPPSGWSATEVSVRFRRGSGGSVRVDGVLCSAPVWLRWDGDTLWLVGSGASPVGDDHIRVRVDVGAGLDVRVRSVAATVAYAARGPGTRWDTEIRVGAGARLDWRTEPVILTEHARHAATTTVAAEPDSVVRLDDVIVLGRSGEPAGAIRSTLSARIGGEPVLLTSTDTSLPGWSGPGGTGGARVLANRLHLAPDGDLAGDGRGRFDHATRSALLTPGPGCRLAVATADDVASARSGLDSALPL
jgi:urease accessory protein